MMEHGGVLYTCSRRQYVPGPDYELVQSCSMTAEPAGGGDTWLLQLPHHVSMHNG
jgi:hypothetical protein